MTSLIDIAPNNLAEFERVYQVFDADGDGTLTSTEIVEALEVLGKGISPQDRQNLLERIDEKGIVTRDSFIEWMSQRQDIDLVADLREIFNLIDVDLSGHLDFEEFTQIIRCLNPNAEDAEITRAIQKADKDGNGEID